MKSEGVSLFGLRAQLTYYRDHSNSAFHSFSEIPCTIMNSADLTFNLDTAQGEEFINIAKQEYGSKADYAEFCLAKIDHNRNLRQAYNDLVKLEKPARFTLKITGSARYSKDFILFLNDKNQILLKEAD